MKVLNRQNLSDLLHGAAILGAGGGGDLSEGFALIDQALAAGKSFRLLSLDEVPDDALICTPYLLGAISALPAEEERLYDHLARVSTHPILTAYTEFQKYLGREFYATVPCELGGSNTAAAFFPAVMNDHFILDADPAGRAVPEITHSTYYLAGLPASPIYAANEFGETFVLDNVVDDQRAETLVRALCQVSRHDIAAIDHALEMKVLRDVLIPGTISRAMHLGEVWRAGKEKPNLAETIAQAGDGRIGFTGRIAAVEYKTSQGFTIGSIEIDGAGNFAGHSFRVAVKNENLAGWLDNEVAVTIPDLICLLDLDSGAPLINPHATVGQSVAVIFLPAPQAFTTEKALSVFGPAYAGLNMTYKPV
jgi:DUF917 family protein